MLRNLVLELQRACAWHELEVLGAKLDRLTRHALEKGTLPPEMPFMNLTRHADPRHNLAVAKSWSDGISRSVSASKTRFSFDERKTVRTRINVGYLSNDFQNHPAGRLMAGLIGLHDPRRFRTFCYSYRLDRRGSDSRKKISRDCDKFVDIRKLNPADAAACMHNDQIDILVDLMGHTANSRLEICALRPAPVQVTYLGFPGTTGADFFDYVITDKMVTPGHHALYYTEKFAYMPHCHRVGAHDGPLADIRNSDHPGMSMKDAPSLRKSDFGLPDDSFVFCSFNQAFKIEASLFDIWMKLLCQVPKSVLWLSVSNETAKRNLRQKAETRGVASERLVFAKRLPSKAGHLFRLGLADLGLDTMTCNGHVTTADALWAGVPVITLKGRHFASRVSSSLVTAIGLPELITDDLQEYEDLAIWLAKAPKELQAIRRRLSRYRLTQPLFDAPRFVRHLEQAYEKMWKLFLAGERPRQIEISRTSKSLEIRPESSLRRGITKPFDLLISENGTRNAERGNQCSAEAYYERGNAYGNQGRLDEAVSCYQKAVTLNPTLSGAYVGMGNIIQARGQSDEAISCYWKAISLKPDSASAYNNMGNVIKDQGDTQEAIRCYQKALELDPSLAAACNNLLFQLQQTCDWQEIEKLGPRLDSFTQKALEMGMRTAEEPFVNLTRHADPARNFAVAKSWSDDISKRIFNSNIDFPHQEKKPGVSKITVGYLSSDFHNHATAHLMLSLFGLHDRDDFDIFCYSCGKDDGSHYRKQIQQDCDKFTDLCHSDPADAARRMGRPR